MVTFDRAGHRYVGQLMTEALEQLGEKLGVTFKTDGGSLGEGSMTIKLKVATNDQSAIEAQARRAVDMAGRHWGITGDDYGAVFETDGGRFRFTGIAAGRPKYPFQGVRVSDGRAFKFGAHVAGKIIASRGARATASARSAVSHTAAMPQAAF